MARATDPCCGVGSRLDDEAFDLSQVPGAPVVVGGVANDDAHVDNEPMEHSCIDGSTC